MFLHRRAEPRPKDRRQGGYRILLAECHDAVEDRIKTICGSTAQGSIHLFDNRKGDGQQTSAKVTLQFKHDGRLFIMVRLRYRRG